MLIRIEGARRKNVVERWLLGCTYREITDQTGVSHGAVVDIIKAFHKGLSDQEAAAVKELAVFSKNSGVPAKDVANLTRIYHQISKIGGVTEPEELDVLVTRLLAMSKEPPARIMGTLAEAIKLADSEGIPFSEVIPRVKQVLLEKKEAEERVAAARKELAQGKSDLERLLHEAGATKTDIAQLRMLQRELGICGIADLKKVPALVRALSSKFQWDAEKVAAFLTSLNEQDNKRTRLAQEIGELQQRHTKMIDTDMLYACIQRTSITYELWVHIENKLREIARAYGKDPNMIIAEALILFVFSYNAHVGLSAALVQLQRNRIQEENRIANLKKIGDNMQQEIDDARKVKRTLLENNNRLESEKNGLRHEISELHAKRNGVREEIAGLRKRLQREIETSAVACVPELKPVAAVFKDSGMMHIASGQTTSCSGYSISAQGPNTPPTS